MDESLRFYEEIVGLSVSRRFKSGKESDIVCLGDGDTKVELIYDENSKQFSIGKDISLGFEVASLDEKLVLHKNRQWELRIWPVSQ